MRSLRLLATVGAVLVLTIPASAQRPQLRDGFWISFGAGGGSLGCDACDDRTNGGVARIELGGTLSPTVRLGASLSGWSKSENGATLTIGLLAAMVRLYPSAAGGFFIDAGLGAGTASLDLGNLVLEEEGLGGMLGVGYDFRVGRKVSITPFLEWFGVNYDPGDANVSSLGVAVTLH